MELAWEERNGRGERDSSPSAWLEDGGGEGWEFLWNWLGKKGMASVCSQLLSQPWESTGSNHGSPREGFGSDTLGSSDGPRQEQRNSQKSTPSSHRDQRSHKSHPKPSFRSSGNVPRERRENPTQGTNHRQLPALNSHPILGNAGKSDLDPPGSANSGSTEGLGVESPSQRDFEWNLGTWISAGLGSAGNSWIQSLKGLFQPKQFREMDPDAPEREEVQP